MQTNGDVRHEQTPHDTQPWHGHNDVKVDRWQPTSWESPSPMTDVQATRLTALEAGMSTIQTQMAQLMKMLGSSAFNAAPATALQTSLTTYMVP